MFDSFDQYLNIFSSGGYDFSDRDDETAKPRRYSLRDWWQAGREDLQAVTQKGNIRFEDTIATPDITPWLPQVLERNVMEAGEPLLVLTQLFEQMPYQAGQTIEFPAVGALSAADLAEGENYPLVRLQESGAVVRASTGKVGVAFEVTEETLNHSRYDIIGLHLRACGRALARHKELKSANMIKSVGKVAFDNVTPTSSMYGVTTGRSMDGTANGSMVLDNLFDTFAMVMMAGFTPNTLIMNPMTFIMFLKDPVLRAVTLAGGNQVWYGGWRGNPAMTGPGSRLGVSGGQNITVGGNAASDTPSTYDEYNQALTSAPLMPSRWAWPLRVVVSPFIPYDPATKRTDIIVCDSMELGGYIEEHGVKVDRWNDLSNDTSKVKLKERYCFHIFNEGLGVALMKNVKVVPNEINLPAQVTHAVSGELQPITATTPVL